MLHLLRTPIPIIRHPPRHQSPLVPLPSPRIEPTLDAPLGHRRHRVSTVRGTSLDFLCGYIRRVARFLFPQRGYHVGDLGVEVDEGKDVVEEGIQLAIEWGRLQKVRIG